MTLLDFFTLIQRERLDGLDATYFSPMTDAERDMAFEYLKDGFEASEENIRGLYLCDPDKAIALFKKTLARPGKVGNSHAENDAILMGRVLMAGYVCNDESSAENIDTLANLDVMGGSEDVRNAFYKQIPSKPTTAKALSRLANGVMVETERLPRSAAVMKLMASYGLLFNMNDDNYKRIYRGLLDKDLKVKKAHLKELEKIDNPVFAQ